MTLIRLLNILELELQRSEWPVQVNNISNCSCPSFSTLSSAQHGP